MTREEHLDLLFHAIDDANATDPVREHDPVTGRKHPRALLYGHRMTTTQHWFAPDAGELLRIAARAQHIRRWEIPRGGYPDGRQGYHQWRRRLARYHAEVAAELMDRHGYSAADRQRVAAMLEKQELKQDPEVQALEDVIGLVFLEHYLEPFVREQGERLGADKLRRILHRTAAKMSPAGRHAAASLTLPDALLPAVLDALEHPR